MPVYTVACHDQVRHFKRLLAGRLAKNGAAAVPVGESDTGVSYLVEPCALPAFSKALSENIAALPPEIRKSAEKLSGERSKIVYILSELGYEDSEIAEFTCTSSDSVRTINNNNKKLLRKDNGFECD